jgi:hypothetical protein
MIVADVEFNGKDIGKLEAEMAEAALAGLRLGAEHVLKLARDRVPIEEGTLERSGRTSDDGDDTVAVSFDTVYAVPQHEHLEWRHDAGRSAKYLEIAVHEGAKAVSQLIRAAVRRVTS